MEGDHCTSVNIQQKAKKTVFFFFLRGWGRQASKSTLTSSYFCEGVAPNSASSYCMHFSATRTNDRLFGGGGQAFRLTLASSYFYEWVTPNRECLIIPHTFFCDKNFSFQKGFNLNFSK